MHSACGNVGINIKKPHQICIENLCLPTHNGRTIIEKPKFYLVDLGLCKRYSEDESFDPNELSSRSPKTGTALYASLNVHQGWPHSRRDDLESLLYVAIELIKGSLPWAVNLGQKTMQETWTAIYNAKLLCSVEDICSGLPDAFSLALIYVRSLSFSEPPDYGYILRLFIRCYEDAYGFDFEFEL